MPKLSSPLTMIVDFSFSNFRSWKTKADFTMMAGKSDKREETLLTPREDLTLLPLSAIYGANASGKSNFIRAILTLQQMVISGQPVYDCFRLEPGMKEEPSVFTIVFLAPASRDSVGATSKELIKFRYEVHIKSQGGKSFVSYEELVDLDTREAYESAVDKEQYKKEHSATSNVNFDGLIFRKICNSNENASVELTVYLTQLASLTNAHMMGLFLNMGKVFQLPILSAVCRWFSDCLHVMTPAYHNWNTLKIFQQYPDQCNLALQSVDTDIDEMTVKSVVIDENHYNKEFIDWIKGIPADTIYSDGKSYVKQNGRIIEYSLCPLHRDSDGNQIEFNMQDESDGTRRFISLLGMMVHDQEPKGPRTDVFIIDELERSLHPELFKCIINKHLERVASHDECSHAQLIFTTHNALILSEQIFRADELWGIEKLNSESTMYSFAEYAEAESDKNLMRSYLRGRLGAVPNL